MAAATTTQVLDRCHRMMCTQLFDLVRANDPKKAEDQTLGEKVAKRLAAQTRVLILLRQAAPPTAAPAEADEPAADGEAADGLDREDGANDNEEDTVNDGWGFDVDRASDEELEAECVRRTAMFRERLGLLEFRGSAGEGWAEAGDGDLGRLRPAAPVSADR